jgi:imidazolonepropionase
MKLIGPFSQLITFQNSPLKGAMTNDQLAIIENGGVLVKDGLVLEVGSFEVLTNKADEVEEVAGQVVAMPGWIDCHTHLLWGGSRAGDFEKRNSGVSYQQILEDGGGIFDTVNKTKSASDEELLDGLNNRLELHLKQGVTTVEIKSGYGLSDPDEIRILRLINQARESAKQLIIPTFLGAHVCPQDYNKEEYLTFLSYEVFPKVKDEGLSNRIDIFVEKEAFSVDLAFPYLTKAKAQGFDLTLHANQFTSGGAYLAAKLGARSADHLEHIDADELKALAQSVTVAVALPGASIGLGAPMTPARKLLDAGASLAIATDWNPGSAPMGDLITQASLITTYEKLSTAEVFAGVTYRAAHALGISDRGRLTQGQKADLVLFDSKDYREILYHMGAMKPSSVFVAGNKVV